MAGNSSNTSKRHKSSSWAHSSHRPPDYAAREPEPDPSSRKTPSAATLQPPGSESAQRDHWSRSPFTPSSRYGDERVAVETGLDCPIRAGPRSRCGWRPLDNVDGFPDITRMRSHVGEHGLRCPDCGRLFNRQTHLKDHLNLKPCSNHKSKTGKRFPLTQTPTQLEQFFKISQLGKSASDVWREGYSILWPDIDVVPSAFYKLNVERRQTSIKPSSHSGSVLETHHSGSDTPQQTNFDDQRFVEHDAATPALPEAGPSAQHEGSHNLFPGTDIASIDPGSLMDLDNFDVNNFMATDFSTLNMPSALEQQSIQPFGSSGMDLIEETIEPVLPASAEPSDKGRVDASNERDSITQHSTSTSRGRSLERPTTSTSTRLPVRGLSNLADGHESITQPTVGHGTNGMYPLNNAMVTAQEQPTVPTTQTRSGAEQAILMAPQLPASNVDDIVIGLSNKLQELRTHGRHIQDKTEKCQVDLHMCGSQETESHHNVRRTYVSSMIAMFERGSIF